MTMTVEERDLRAYFQCAEAACGLRSPSGYQLEAQRQGTLGCHGAAP